MRRNSVTSAFDLRSSEFSLPGELEALEGAVGDLLGRVVRPGDEDQIEFWHRLLELGLLEMVVEQDEQERAGLTALSLVAFQLGRFALAGPYVESAVALRSLRRTGSDIDLRPVLEGSTYLTVALRDLSATQPVPAGAIASSVLGVEGEELVLVRLGHELAALDNAAHAPTGRWCGIPADAERVVVSSGHDAVQAWTQVMSEWQLLTAGFLAGVASGAVDDTVAFSLQRHTRGVPIASLQAIAHLIVDADVARVTARNLVLKAAWFADNEPEAHPHLTGASYFHAVDAGGRATRACVHVHGGQGVSLESSVSRAFLLASFVPAHFQDPDSTLDGIADVLFARPLPGDQV